MNKRFISMLLSMTIISTFTYGPVYGASSDEAVSTETAVETVEVQKEEVIKSETINGETLVKTLEETLLEIENLVAKAEETKAAEDIEKAKLAVEALEDSQIKTDYLERLKALETTKEEVLVPTTTVQTEEAKAVEELPQTAEVQQLAAESTDPASIYGKTLIKIVPDRRIAEGLLSKAFPGQSVDSFVITEDNIGKFTQFLYSEDRSSNNYDTVNFEGIQYFKNLKTISLYFVNIDEFPSQILELKDLTSLTLTGVIQKPRISENTIVIPEEITTLTKLTNINFNNNMVKELPEFLSEMTQLRSLNFTGSNYYHDSEYVVPESYVNLVNLYDFSLSNNHMKYLPSNLYQYKGLTSFRFMYNNLLEISDENYNFIQNMKTNKLTANVGDQYYGLVQEEAHNKSDENKFIEINFPEFVDFMSDKSSANNKLGVENIVFSLYYTNDNYENTPLIRESGNWIDKDQDNNIDGIYESADKLLKYDSNTNKFLISNKLLKESNDFRFITKMYDGIFKESTYWYDFTTITDIQFETEYKINLEMPAGETKVVQEGVNGIKNNQGVIVTPAVNEIIEYGPLVIPYLTEATPDLDLEPGKIVVIQEGINTLKNPLNNDEVVQEGQKQIEKYGPDAIPFKTIRKENLDLAPGTEKVIVEGVIGRVDRDGTILLPKRDEIIEFGPDKKDDGPVIVDPPVVNDRPEKDRPIEKDTTRPETTKTKDHIQYIQGYPDGTVRPDSEISRAEAAAMIARLLDLKLDDKSSPDYKDMKSDTAWYNKYVNAVTRNGLMEGYPDGTFAPEEEITRGEFAEMIKSLEKNASKTTPFTDVDKHWALDAIEKAYGEGSIDGYPDKTFRPDEPITRAETAKILNHLFHHMVRSRGLEEMDGKLNKYVDLKSKHWAYYEIIEASNSHKYTNYTNVSDEEDWTSTNQKTWNDSKK